MADKLNPAERRTLLHWSVFGQKGEPSDSRVTAAGWEIVPFETPITSAWGIKVPHTELRKLLNGFSPRAMEDKWFLYADGPDAQGNVVLHMFRSWTGHKMAELKIKMPVGEDGECEEEDAKVTEITWESNPERYNGQTEEGAKIMAKEVCNWVLDVTLG
jgi:hypothetical protein